MLTVFRCLLLTCIGPARFLINKLATRRRWEAIQKISLRLEFVQDLAGVIERTVSVVPETSPVTVTFCPAYLSICLVSPFSV